MRIGHGAERMVRRQVDMLYALCSMLIMKTAKDMLWTWLLEGSYFVSS